MLGNFTFQLFEESAIFLLLHPFFLPILLFTIAIYRCLSPNSNSKKNLPPSPPRLPIIGILHQLHTYPHRSFQNLSQKYGDLMLVHLGSKPAIVVSSAEVAAQFLKTHDLIFSGRPHSKGFRRLLGNGKDILSSPYGEYWRKMRGICVLHLLSNKRVRSFSKVREEEVALMTKNIARSSTVNLSEMFMSLNNDLICKVAFGNKYVREESGIDFTKLLDDFFKLLGGYYIGDYISWLGWVDWINGVNAKLRRVTSTFDEFLERVIQQHSIHRRERNGDGEENAVVMKDFVDVLLEYQRDDRSENISLDKESIKSLILDIFAAGTDTSYVLLEWMMSELIRNPRIMKELQKEVTGIVGDKNTVTEDDTEKMKYLKAMVKETLRLHPPVPLIPPHESTKDVKIKGYDIDAGTQVIVNVWAIGRDPTYWEDPEKFYPERFLNSPVDFRGQDFQLIPFGSGRRICPGITFAITTVELVVANLVHQFDWALPYEADEESLDMTESPVGTAHRKDPLLVVATPRLY